VVRQADGVLGTGLRTTVCHGRIGMICVKEFNMWIKELKIEDEDLSREFGDEEWE
jgi:hypothetical protein